MTRKILSLLSLLFLATLIGCSSSETEKTDGTDKKSSKDSVMVFEEAVPDTANKNLEMRAALEKSNKAKEESAKPLKYSVQIGAFTTMEKADHFAAISKKKVNHELTVSYNDAVKLFVVQVTPAFPIKTDAEDLRARLWKLKEFKDAWIVLVVE